jgi:hypothetical protein
MFLIETERGLQRRACLLLGALATPRQEVYSLAATCTCCSGRPFPLVYHHSGTAHHLQPRAPAVVVAPSPSCIITVVPHTLPACDGYQIRHGAWWWSWSGWSKRPWRWGCGEFLPRLPGCAVPAAVLQHMRVQLSHASTHARAIVTSPTLAPSSPPLRPLTSALPSPIL